MKELTSNCRKDVSHFDLIGRVDKLKSYEKLAFGYDR